MKWVIHAKGHENILAKHKSTWQLTRDSHLTPRGDCIIGVMADQSAVDIPDDLKRWLMTGNWVDILLTIGNTSITGKGKGASGLSFEDNTDMVFRRSDYTCPRTITTHTSFTAIEIPRTLISELQNPTTEIKVEIISQRQ